MAIKDIPGPAADTVERICKEMTSAKGRKVTQREGWELAAEALALKWQMEKDIPSGRENQ